MNLYIVFKINSKWITDLSIKPKIIKLLEENKRENLCELGFSKRFSNMAPKAQFMKERTDKFTSSKLKTTL